MHRKREKETLQDLPLAVGDAIRLVMECTEELGEQRIQGLGREELLRLIRRTLHKGVAAVEASERTVSFREAALQSVTARQERRPTTCRDLRHYVRRMLRVDDMPERPLRAMSTADCRALLQQAFGGSIHSYRKGRAILHSIFHYGQQHEWCEQNPVDCISTPSVREQTILPLSLQEVERLQRTAAQPQHRSMQLSLHLMMYCGLRPYEVQRLALSDICWEEKEVLIRPRVSKTGGGRVVPLRCVQKLQSLSPIIPVNWQRRWQALRKAAGFTHWQADALRHTFASYHAAYFRDLPALQLEMGHRDTNLLRTRYTIPVSRRSAAQFWGERVRS